MNDIKKYGVLKEKESGDLFVIIDQKDLCNCELSPVNFEGSWIACLDQHCPDTEIELFEFMN